MSDCLMDMIRKHIQLGESIAQIARSTGVHRKTVASFLGGETIKDDTRAKLARSRPQTAAERKAIRRAAAEVGGRARHMVRGTAADLRRSMKTPEGKALMARLQLQRQKWEVKMAEEVAKDEQMKKNLAEEVCDPLAQLP